MIGRDLIARLGLTPMGRDWRGTCPACGYGSNAFSLSVNRDGSLHGWCASCQDRSAIDRALEEGGEVVAAVVQRSAAERKAHTEKMIGFARGLWIRGLPVPRTSAELYLKRRCIPWLTSVLFGPMVPHPSRLRLPAMLAAMVNVRGDFTGVHRTYLTPDGRKADVTPDKATLGAMWGSVIRLEDHNPKRPLVIGEGIETSASAGKLLGAPAWAAISAGNLEQALELPAEVRSIIIAADRGEAGERAAERAAERWLMQDRKVRIDYPKEGDFNDVLIARGKRNGR